METGIDPISRAALQQHGDAIDAAIGSKVNGVGLAVRMQADELASDESLQGVKLEHRFRKVGDKVCFISHTRFFTCINPEPTR
jgi:hypothetical protein